MNNSIKTSTQNNSKKQQPGFWTHFAISLTIVGGMLVANFSSKAAESSTVEVIGSGKPMLMISGGMARKCLEFNHDSRHFIMLDQPDWLTGRIANALKD